jgi:hypothetical protein
MTSPSITEPSLKEHTALMRLIQIAKRDSGQSGRVASFLLAWWNAPTQGGFDLTDLWSVDEDIADDMMLVLGYIRRCRQYPDALGHKHAFEKIIAAWRTAIPINQ